jgi:ribosomal protein S18 acetylase RimI-like enzyme
MESARPALHSDGSQVGSLRAVADRSLKGARGAALLSAQRGETSVPWATWVDDPNRLAVVGTLEEHIVGYGLARLDRSIGQHLLGVIEEVWVEVGARSVGVGEALMDLITEWCISAGCTGLDAVALPGDRLMKGFFERYGLTARLLVMHRALQGPGPANDGAVDEGAAR